MVILLLMYYSFTKKLSYEILYSVLDYNWNKYELLCHNGILKLQIISKRAKKNPYNFASKTRPHLKK